MRKLAGLCFLAAALPLGAAEIQGYLADWKCVQKIVKDGAEQTYKNDKSCSLHDNYNRQAYGLITQDKHFYRLDAVGNDHARQLLPKAPYRDRLFVIVTGDLQGNFIKVKEMSVL